jgi:TRAP transporter 4TM/12TM fusion protein
MDKEQKSKRVKGIWKYVIIICTSIAILLSVNQIFQLRLFGLVFVTTQYLYLLLLLFFPLIFIIKSASKSCSDRIPWYDIVLYFVSLLICFYYAYNAYDIQVHAWIFNDNIINNLSSLVMWVLILEGSRRALGFPFLIIGAILSLYPLFANKVPDILSGQSYEFWELARRHLMGEQGVIGLPLNVVGNILLGFIIFGIILSKTGGGSFFMNLALSALGKARGGPAKVAVLSSALFGSLSGSVISNVILTGSMTIPAMIKAGYPPEEAAAIESCASTGGVLMPPVMGAIGFIAASLLNVPYLEIAKAALIPSVLFYISLLVHSDLFAARKGLKSWVKEEIPSFKETMAKGWFYLFAFAALLYCLIYLRMEAWAPYIACAILLVITMVRSETRLNGKQLLDLLESAGHTLIDLVTMMAGIGLILGSVFITGLGASFARSIVAVSGGNVYLLLLLGALVSFILGMGMTISACYIFLAILLTPALEQCGLSQISIHIFLLYWGMLSNITPPVAIAAFTAASLIKGNPIKVGYKAMKVGIILYFVPFFCVLNPELMLEDFRLFNFAMLFITAIIGIFAIVSAIQGYTYYLGKISNSFYGIITRGLALISGMMLLLPNHKVSLFGTIFLILTIILWRMFRASHDNTQLMANV